MKKFSTLFLMAGMLMIMGCGGSGGNSSGSGKVSGEVYTSEVMSVLVPKGWKAFPGLVAGTIDEFREDQVAIHKGAKQAIDQLDTPGIVINYFPQAKYARTPGKTWYDNVSDIAPFTMGNYEWEGFTGSISNRKCAIFWTTNADELFQVVAWLEYDGKKISLDDADVKALIASISTK